MKKTSLLITALIFAISLHAELKVATLNCYFLFSPANHEKTVVKGDTLNDGDYEVKLEHLAKMIISQEPDVVALQEIGCDLESGDLARRIELLWPAGGRWEVAFVQGNDHYTGQDVATLVRTGGGARRIRTGRVPELDKTLSKHLLTIVEKDGKRYSLVNVHLIRPVGDNELKHVEQLDKLTLWIQGAGELPVVLGDFNSSEQGMLPLPSAGDLTGNAPTQLSGKELDYIFSRERPITARLTMPPYGKKPSNYQKGVWTDHFMLFAVLP